MDYLGPAFFLKYDGLPYWFSGEHFSLHRVESFGSLLGERERKKPGKSKAPDRLSQGEVSGRSPEASPPQGVLS